MSNVPVTVAYGDGIGPEIMEATLDILDKAGAELDIETIEVGLSMYEKGNTTGIAPNWARARRSSSSPSIPGIRWSESRRSNGATSRCDSASSLFAAVSTA